MNKRAIATLGAIGILVVLFAIWIVPGLWTGFFGIYPTDASEYRNADGTLKDWRLDYDGDVTRITGDVCQWNGNEASLSGLTDKEHGCAVPLRASIHSSLPDDVQRAYSQGNRFDAICRVNVNTLAPSIDVTNLSFSDCLPYDLRSSYYYALPSADFYNAARSDEVKSGLGTPTANHIAFHVYGDVCQTEQSEGHTVLYLDGTWEDSCDPMMLVRVELSALLPPEHLDISGLRLSVRTDWCESVMPFEPTISGCNHLEVRTWDEESSEWHPLWIDG